jgi:hypothetical protein
MTQSLPITKLYDDINRTNLTAKEAAPKHSYWQQTAAMSLAITQSRQCQTQAPVPQTTS